MQRHKFSLTDFLWNVWCIFSVVGIWPRFIEPKLLLTSKKTVILKHLPKDLDGLKIVQFSDLHFHEGVSDAYLKKIARKIEQADPDILVFTGDFLCYSQMPEEQAHRLSMFLNRLKARYGCFAVFGNHDYAQYVSINDEGDYACIAPKEGQSSLVRGFKRLFHQPVLTKKITPQAKKVPLNTQLVELLQKSPFKLLENGLEKVKIKNSYLNICGLGEYILGRIDPLKAFEKYDHHFPGLILVHNPDGIPKLEGYPGEIVLCGHTHGGQVNLPWMWKRFTLMENKRYKRGMIFEKGRWIYVNRGVGDCLTFRWFSPPEILSLTLQ